MNESQIEEKLFAPLSKQSAPESLRLVLDRVEQVFGFIPNLMGTFANAPAVAMGYHALIVEFTKGSFTPQEQQIILLAVSVENNGNYCTIAHSAAARSLARVAPEVIDAIRNKKPVPDPKLNALVSLTQEIVRQRGYAGREVVDAFIRTGYRKEQIMEILLGIALKTISNYLDHVSPIETDQAFRKEPTN
jgi:AhpD family alkylhydroperoxidase